MNLSVIQKRIILFILGCIVTRLGFVWLAYNIKKDWLPILGLLALIPAFGFIYIYSNGLRKTGSEVFGDKIWWNDLRPFHALMYIFFAILAFNRKNYAWIPLLIDVSVGFSAFVIYHTFFR